MEYEALALEVLEDEDLDSKVAQYDTDTRVLTLRLGAALVLVLADVRDALWSIRHDGIGVG